MKRKTANIDIRVESQLIERIDAWRAQRPVPPSTSAAIVYMLEHFLENDPPGLKRCRLAEALKQSLAASGRSALATEPYVRLMVALMFNRRTRCPDRAQKSNRPIFERFRL